jgi:NhaP-type Na+/H+ or K+/H+ antiporter
MGTFEIIIAASVIIILSHMFNVFAKKTNIPSVLMLIVLGIILHQAMLYYGISKEPLMPALEVLGNVGLIMIVLEAAIDLKLKKERWPIIWKSFLVALLALIGSAFACALIIHFFIIEDKFTALLYAIPLSIMSSAIIIPSMGNLVEHKKEFMVYESTFSDILGIMFFYFMLGNAEAVSAKEIISDVLLNIFITIGLSIIISYALIWVFQKLKSQVKLFLLISVLLLLYAIGKKFHLSSLVIILVFGLVLNNSKLFFIGPLKKIADQIAIKKILHDFHIVIGESAFAVRTFFFVIFGISINLSLLLNLEVAIISSCIVLALFAVRYVFLKLFLWNDIIPQLFIAPRGLITILLFFAIPLEFQNDDFAPSILLYTIILTSLVMTFALIKDGKKIVTESVDISEDDI